MEHHLSCVTCRCIACQLQLWLTHSMSSRCKHVHVIIPFETEFRLRTTLQALQGRRGEQLHAAVESERIYVRIQPFLFLSLSLSFKSVGISLRVAVVSCLLWCMLVSCVTLHVLLWLCFVFAFRLFEFRLHLGSNETT